MAENFNQMLFDEEIETDNTQTQASGSSQQVNSSDSVIFIKPLPRVQNNDDLKVDNFFNQVLQTYQLTQPVNKLVFITINHIVRTLPPYLRALEKIGRIAAVIPKASFHDEKIYAYVQQNYNLAIEITKEKLKLPNEAVKFIRSLIKPDEKLVIIDIGGYFASPLPELDQDELVRKCLLGIVEDTENGMQKYAAIIKNSKFPVVSVARSFLKETEDYNVGKSIVRATDGVLRRDAHGLQERYKNIGIIGVGKIGFSIAKHLQAEAGNVTICDLNPQRAMYASSRGLQQASKESILEQSDLIFSSTGNKGLKGDDFLNLRNNVFIASVTSADDEIDIQGLQERTVEKHQENNITRYVLKNGCTINLLYHGNAINFVDGAINGPCIYSVQAELLICALQLARNQYSEKPTQVIYELADADMSRIAAIWNRVFDGNMTWSDEPVFTNAPIKTRHFVETETKYINKTSLTHFFNIPNYTQHFSGRDQIRQKIIDYIQHDIANKPIHPYVIAGMGGIGKTQLALNCAWNVRDQFVQCIYICAESLATITTSFQQTAQQFGIQMEENLEKLLPLIYKVLKRQGRSLLVFDDAPSKSFLSPYLPSSALGYSSADFAVLITSRDQTQWHQCEKLLLDPEQPEIKQDAEVYLQKQLNCSAQEAGQLANTVHHLPLALSQLVAYIKKVNCSVARCMELLKQNKKRQHVLSEPSQEDGEQKYKRVVLTLWQLSIESLNKEVPQARDIIELCAYLFADKIQMAIFNNTSENSFFDSIIVPLQSYSLIYLIDDSNFRIHRLLQEVIRATLKAPENLCQKLINLLSTYSPRYNRNNIEQLSNTYLHYQTISTYLDLKKIAVHQNSHLKLLYALGSYCQDYLYDYASSRHYFEHAIKLQQTDKELTLKIKRLLAKAYFRTNEIKKAEKLYQELSSVELPPKLASKMVLDRYLFLQEIEQYESAKKLLNDFLNATIGDKEDKARAYHYLIKDEIRHINILNKKLGEASTKEFSSWQTDNIRKNKEYIESLQSKISDLMSTILLWIEKSLAIKKANNNYREILRTSLLLFETVRNHWSIPAVQKVVDLMCNLYIGNEAALQHLPREHYASDFFCVSKHLAHLLNNFPECFKDSFEKLKRILAEEQSWVEKYFGVTSNEHIELKKISSHKQNKQTSLQFKPVSRSNHSQPAPTIDVDEMQVDNLETKKASDSKITTFFNPVTKKTSQDSNSINAKKRSLLDEQEQPPAAKRPKIDQANVEVMEIDDSDDEAEKIKLSKPSK